MMNYWEGGGPVFAVFAGLLDRTEGILKVIGHEFVKESPDGGVSAILKEISGQPLILWAEEGGPLYEPPSKPVQPPTVEFLPMKCLCGNIDLHISRPSPTEVPPPSEHWRVFRAFDD